MRIISGSHKSRLLKPPLGLPVRPTTDLAKESLFNILNNYIDFEDVKVLDLFAGTGNVSFEFASRGATLVVGIETNTKCVDFISKTATELKFQNLSVIKADAFVYLSRQSVEYDVIFADPPYDMPEREKVVKMVLENNWLSDEGWFVLEHDKYLNFAGHPLLYDERRYGKVHFSFFRKSPPEAEGQEDQIEI